MEEASATVQPGGWCWTREGMVDAGYNSEAEPGDSLMVWMWSDRGEELRMTPRSLGQARTQLPRVCDGRQGPHSPNPISVHARCVSRHQRGADTR